jgi:hypothetical protein
MEKRTRTRDEIRDYCPDCHALLTDRTTRDDGGPAYCDSCDREVSPPPIVWAAYFSYRGYAELFLTTTELEALKAIGAIVEADDDQPTEEMDTPTLRDYLGEIDGLHWHVAEVNLP